MEAIPIALFWLLAVWGLASRPQMLLYLLFCTMPFGAFAVIPPALTAGLTFTPTPMVALLIVLRHLGHRRGFAQALAMALTPSHLLLLLLFWLVAAFTTFFMPRLFAGEVAVIPMRLTFFTYGEPLQPTTQNISQLAYLTISVVAVFAFARLLRAPAMRQHAMAAIVAGGAAAVFTGLLDFATQFVPISPLLEPFRTATYALLTEVEVLNAKRVVGLMPEASAFGGMSLAFLTAIYFFRRGMESAFLRRRAAPALMALLFLMVWLSTSSAAYVGLALFGCMAALEWLWRAAALHRRDPRRAGLGVEARVVIGAVSGLCLVLLLVPSLLDPVVAMVDTMVLQKTASSSFEERSMWTAVSWQALLDTWGLGVGLGATRASNSIVAVASSTGFLGAFLYYAFTIRSLTRRARPGDAHGAAMISAVRWSFPPGLVLGILAGTSADFGSWGAFRHGLMLAVATSVVARTAYRGSGTTGSRTDEGVNGRTGMRHA